MAAAVSVTEMVSALPYTYYPQSHSCGCLLKCLGLVSVAETCQVCSSPCYRFRA